MAVNLFDWRSLTDLVNKQQSPEAFVADTIFGRSQDHLSDKVDLEIISGSKRVAEYINRGEAARVVNKRARVAKTVKLPELALSQFFSPQELFMQKDAGGLGSPYASNAGQLNDYRNRRLAESAQELKDRISRARELMACQALQGKITVAQDNLEFEVDFGYVTNTHLVTLAGAAKWDTGTAKMLDDIRKYRRQTMNLCGFPADKCIIGTGAAEKLLADATIQKILDTNNFRTGTVDLNGPQGKAATRIGMIAGIEFWEYNQQYQDTAGADADFINPKNAIFVASQCPHFRTHWGPVFREDGIHTEHFYGRTFTVKNPDGTYQEVASSFLTAVHDPDAVVCVTTY